MKRDIINPWRWQEALGFVHANKISEVNELVFLSGQTASDEQGNTIAVGDMAGQINKTLDNIGTILSQAGLDFSNVLRLNIYTIDLPGLLAVHDHMVKTLQERGCQHAGTLLGVSALAAPNALIEMEVTAAS